MTQQIQDLTDLQLLALSKVACPKVARAACAPCHQEGFDFTVRVRGHLTIQEDVQKPPTTSIPYKVVIGMMLARIPKAERDKTAAVLTECMREALALDEKARKVILDNYPELSEAEDAIGVLMAQLPKVTNKGGVLSHLNIDLVPGEVPAKDET